VPVTDRPFDPAATLAEITDATARLLETVEVLDDPAVRQPSLLPGWSRGHVLTHLARNADGGRRLLSWARTGVQTPEYASMAARAADIEAGAGRPVRELAADVRDSAAAFAQEYARMPAAAWDRLVRWTAGKQRPAARAADSRLTEVLVHHVDLDAGYAPGDWPPAFIDAMLERVVAAFGSREGVPPVRLYATDTGSRYRIGSSSGAVAVRGPRASLLAWLMGRSRGTDLATTDGATLPVVPFLY
jgi:maleylpyruvate isomerase